MQGRTFEQYKKEVFDKLDDRKRCEWLYEMSKQLCEVEEKVKDRIKKMEWAIDFAQTDKSSYSQGEVEVLKRELEFLKGLFKEGEF